MTHSRLRPHGSKLWTNEIMRGAPLFQDMLEEHMSKGAKFMEEKIRQWVDEKRINPVEPSALLYMIWASTQHYADFDYQVNVLNGHQPLSDQQFDQAVKTITAVILRGIGLEP